ncbi:hypothetical protein ACJIZ3_003279 [Penstemon smallii]|uniref:Uncharacterized protein n=1 Tax=Penstemon smallii TaxID=265156 RepID=A0ABD3UAC5_9LAMI
MRSIVFVFEIIMYGFHLLVIRDVCQTKSVECLPFWFCLASFLNAVVWFIYAFLPPFDPFLAIVNGIGTLSGLVQLGCLHRFRHKSYEIIW